MKVCAGGAGGKNQFSSKMLGAASLLRSEPLKCISANLSLLD
jgi:hypothetical protein